LPFKPTLGIELISKGRQARFVINKERFEAKLGVKISR